MEVSNKELYNAFKKAPFKVKITALIMLLMKYFGYKISDLGWWGYKKTEKIDRDIDKIGSKMFKWAWND